MERIFSSSSSSFAIRPQDLLLDVIPKTTTTTTTTSSDTAATTRANNDNDNDNTHKSNQPKQPFLHRLLEEENNNDNNHDKDNEHNKRPRRSFYALPSVLERIEGLYQSIPNSHPFNNDIRNLISDLKNENNIKCDKKSDDNDNDSKNNNLIRRLSSVTYAHRLHASLLSRCTVRLEPDPYYQNNHHRRNNNNNDDHESFTVTLERYMGDVLSARCLIGHSYIGGSTSGNMAFGNNSNSSITGGGIDAEKVIVEGGPSFDKWIDYLISFQQITTNINDDDNDRIPSAKDWYQYWVFLHSALLRVSPFSIRQADKLKIGPLSGILEPFDINNNGTTGNENDDESMNDHDDNIDEDSGNHQDHRQQQDTWFLPSRTFAGYSCKFRYVNVLSDRLSPLFRHNNQRVGVLQTTMNDFGPLGNFRGRDRVSTQVMLPHKLYVILLRNMLLSWKLNNNRLQDYIDRDSGTTGREYVTDLRRWLNGSDKHGVMQWMKLLQDQSQKNHPMTVQPPLVTIRMTTNNMERQRLADR
jgi:hypothetical protein